MAVQRRTVSRRRFLGSALGGALGLATLSVGAASTSSPAAALTRPIAAGGQRVPAIGMGSWITFNVGDDVALRRQRTEVLDTFFRMGGAVIDSSPMYGSSEEVIGYALNRLDRPRSLFSATKVWTYFAALGRRQMAASRELWGVERFDLMQIHNLLDWETHLETLIADKAAGRVGLIGATTSHGRRHEEMERVMAHPAIDCVQFTYNIVDREAEARLLPMAAERGLGVVINRPFRRGALIDRLERHPLPDWAGEIDCANWPQFLLKFIVSHPAVSCAIPATSRVDHMRENMGALTGRVPDAALRRRMADYVTAL